MLSYVIIVLLVAALAVATAIAYNRGERIKFRDFQIVKLKRALLDTHDSWAKDSNRFMDRLNVGRERMAQIAAIVSRRPPRRKWLADARNIAKIASDSI